MNKIIVTLAILGAIAIMLYQVINWKEVSEEYEPVVTAFRSAVDMLPNSEPEVEEVEEVEVVAIEQEPTGTAVFEISDRDEIASHIYERLRRIVDICHPTQHKENIKAAFANDGIIRIDEYFEMISQCNDWHESQNTGAKDELKEFVNGL